MDLGLSGKVAVITGSTRGLGLASATSLVAEGCHVCVCGRSQETLDAAVTSLTAAAAAPARVLGVRADLATEAGIRTVIEGAIAEFGGIDVLVNNVALARGTDILNTTDADWQEAFATRDLAPLMTTIVWFEIAKP